MKKAVIISGALAQDHEFIYPYYRLLEAKFILDVCIIGGKAVKGILGTTLPPNKDQVIKDINEIKTNDYDLLVLPGGVKALEKLRQEAHVLEFIKLWNSEGKVIASTCHGAQLLISAKIITNRNVSGYYSIKDDITNAGAHYVKAPVVVDDNLVTSPHYDFMGPWMKAAINAAGVN